MWVERVQQCEGRIAALQRQVEELAIARRYLGGEAEDNAYQVEACTRRLCDVRDQMERLLDYVSQNAESVADERVKLEIRRIAQLTDTLCRDQAARAGNVRDRADERMGRIERVIEFEFDEREEQRLSEAPGYNEFSSSDEDSD